MTKQPKRIPLIQRLQPLDWSASPVPICCCLLLAAGTPSGVAAGPLEPSFAGGGNRQENKALRLQGVPDGATAAASAYSAGVSLVYRGRRLETAAEQLAVAVRLEPQNPEYHLALGCALVRRAAVLRRATISAINYQTEKPEYPNRYAVWEKAQSDRNSALYRSAPPSVPEPPITVDDGKPFTLPPQQAKERAADLCQRALTEWDAALATARTDAERANIRYVGGWGLILIKRLALYFGQVLPGSENTNNGGQGDPWQEGTLVPSHQQVAEQFQAALAISPNNARYWQSLGDAYVTDSDPKQWSREKAIEAYEKALTIDRRSPTLWYQLYKMHERSDPDAAAKAIEKAVQIDASNSYYWFLLANLRLKRFAEKVENAQEAVKEAKTISNKDGARSSAPGLLGSPDLSAGLAALEKGNAGTFRPASYLFAIPKILAPLNAIDIGVTDALYDSYILGIPQNVDIAVKAYLAAGNTAKAIVAARTLVGFSDKMMSLGETHTNASNEYLAWMYNLTPIHYSYTSLATALEQAGDGVGAVQARARMQEMETLARKRMQRGKERLGS